VGIVAGVAWALLGSSLLVVRSVVVTGTHLVPASQVEAAAAIPAGEPMIRVGAAAAASRVGAITQVQSAQVTKSWPDRIVITVRERTPALAVAVPASVSASGGYYLVDASGVIVRWARTVPRGMPWYATTAGPAALRGDPALAASVTVLHQVPAWVSGSVTEVYASSPQAVTLRLSSGVTIVWGSTSRASVKARELAILMRTHARYYDVSAPGSAVTR
jgi:cell division protein FtsQ